jgi:hypothetical protein
MVLYSIIPDTLSSYYLMPLNKSHRKDFIVITRYASEAIFWP